MRSATKARAFSQKMTREVAAELLIGQDPNAPISDLHVESILRQFRPRFEEGLPERGVTRAASSGRAFVTRALEGKGLELPAGAEPLIPAFSAEDFEAALKERVKAAREQGVPLERFAKSLADGKVAELTGRQVMANVAHTEQRAQKATEESMYRDIAAANPGRLRIRFTRIGAKPCRVCSPLSVSGQSFEVSDSAERSKYRTPQHKGCRCIWVPVVDGDAPSDDFFQRLAARIDEASKPIRATYRTAPNLAGYVKEAKERGIKTVDDVTRVGRRAMEDIQEDLAKQLGFKEKEEVFRAKELEFKAAEIGYRYNFIVRGSTDNDPRATFEQARDTWDLARREVADIRRSAVKRAVSRVVELGGEEPFVWHKNNMTKMEIRESVSRIASLIPRPWLERHLRDGDVMVGNKVDLDLACYRPRPKNRPDKPGNLYIGGASKFVFDETALHETCHPLELVHPRLNKFMREFRDHRLTSGGQFSDSYFKKSYKNGGTEILSSGMEALYFSSRRVWSEDEELLEFLVGAMLVL